MQASRVFIYLSSVLNLYSFSLMLRTGISYLSNQITYLHFLHNVPNNTNGLPKYEHWKQLKISVQLFLTPLSIWGYI
jgi:hypothetical protein